MGVLLFNLLSLAFIFQRVLYKRKPGKQRQRHGVAARQRHALGFRRADKVSGPASIEHDITWASPELLIGRSGVVNRDQLA